MSIFRLWAYRAFVLGSIILAGSVITAACILSFHWPSWSIVGAGVVEGLVASIVIK